jgi:hypothetical protein
MFLLALSAGALVKALLFLRRAGSEIFRVLKAALSDFIIIHG